MDCEHFRYDLARFTAPPSAIEHLGPMFLSDPPLRDVDVFLFYRHTNSSFAVSVRARIEQDTPLTLRSMVDTANVAEGNVYLEGNFTTITRNWCQEHQLRSCRLHREKCIEHLDDVSLRELTTQHMRKHGGQFTLDLEQSWVGLRAICPSDEEWKTMWDVLEEEKERERLMDPEEYAAWKAAVLI